MTSLCHAVENPIKIMCVDLELGLFADSKQTDYRFFFFLPVGSDSWNQSESSSQEMIFAEGAAGSLGLEGKTV